MYNRSKRLTRFNRSNLTEQQQLKKKGSGNFYLLQEPDFPDQENRGGGIFFHCFQRLVITFVKTFQPHIRKQIDADIFFVILRPLHLAFHVWH